VKEKKERQKLDAIKKEEGVEKPGEMEKDVTVPPESTNHKPVAKKRRHVRGIWAVTLILVLCALLATAVWIYVISSSNNAISSFLNINRDKTTKDEQKKEEEAKKGLKEYVNLSALFLFDYPDTWTLAEQNNVIILSSDSIYPKAYFAGEGPEMKDTDIYLQIHFSNQTIDISREAPAIKPKFSTIDIGGVSAKRVTYKNEDIYSDIIQNFQAGDFYFLIIADTKSKNTDKIDAYNKILASFKFGKDVVESAKNK
jgi:hypothetical protein